MSFYTQKATNIGKSLFDAYESKHTTASKTQTTQAVTETKQPAATKAQTESSPQTTTTISSGTDSYVDNGSIMTDDGLN